MSVKLFVVSLCVLAAAGVGIVYVALQTPTVAYTLLGIGGAAAIVLGLAAARRATLRRGRSGRGAGYTGGSGSDGGGWSLWGGGDGDGWGGWGGGDSGGGWGGGDGGGGGGGGGGCGSS